MKIPRTFYDRVESLFPYPIASGLMDIRQSVRAIDKFNKYIPFFKVIIQYCTFIALCDYLSCRKRNEEIDCEIDDFFNSTPDLSLWIKLLRNILKIYINRREDLFMPELCSFMFDDSGKLTDNSERLEHVLNIANKFDGKPCKSEKQASMYFEKMEVLLIEILEELSFLIKYPLVKPVMFKSQSDGYVINSYRCVGNDPGFKYDRINSADPFSMERLQILKPEKKELLELHPFLLSSRCTVCQKTHIFLFEHIEDNSLHYISPIEGHKISSDSLINFMEELLDEGQDLRKQIDYEDLWMDFRFNKEKDFAEKYMLLELVGRGGMGDVYKTLQTNLGSIRAIKILPRNLSSNLKCIKRFEQEAKLAARMEHENIVRVIDVGAYDEERFIVMEYIEGTTLRDILNERKNLPQEEVINLTTAIASGLKWIHQNDIIHRDIKPENIMIDISGKVKITDFGISRSIISARFTAAGMPIGTAQYFSPEQAGAPGEISFYSDIYSLGVVIYEMLTGNFPHTFKENNPLAIAYTIVNTSPIPIRDVIPDLSSELETIVMKCLEKNPKNRYADAGELLNNLKKLSESRSFEEDDIFQTKKVSREDGFKFFLEGLMWSGELVEGAEALIEERRISLGLSTEDVRRAEEEIKLKIRDASKMHKSQEADEVKNKKKSDKKTREALDKKKEAIMYLDKGDEYYSKKDYDSSIKEYKKALDLAPHMPAVHNSLGNAYYYLEQYELAIKEYEMTLTIDPNNPVAEKNLAHIRKILEQSNKEKAIPEEKKSLDESIKQYTELYEMHLEKGYLTDEEKRRFRQLKEQLGLSSDIISQIEKSAREKIATRSKGKKAKKEKHASPSSKDHLQEEKHSIMETIKKQFSEDEMATKIKEDINIKKNTELYREIVENLWSNKEYLTDKELKEMEQKKLKLRLTNEVTEKIEREIEDKIKTRKRARLDMIDMAISSYRSLLENIWSKGHLTEQDEKLLHSQREEYGLSEDIAIQIEKEVENTAKTREEERIKKALAGYKEMAERLWGKGFLSDKETETIEHYKAEHRLPSEKLLEIDLKFKEYRDKKNDADRTEQNIGKKAPPDIKNLNVYSQDALTYSTFVSREKELEELLSYYMSSDKTERDMVGWALLNTFESLKQQLRAGERDWATPSFIKSLKKARTLMPEDRRQIISLLDDIIKGL